VPRRVLQVAQNDAISEVLVGEFEVEVIQYVDACGVLD
jgi:hypothetical protein